MFDLLLKNEFRNDIFDSFFNDLNTFFDSNWTQDKDGNAIFEIEVPGFNQDNIKVELTEGILTIQGQTERRKIHKRYTVGNIEDIDASIKDGILSLTLKQPEKNVKQIELKS